MEEITINELDKDYYKAELESAIRQLHEAREEIKSLESEIDDQNEIVRELRAEIDRISHEDEVIITTKHTIENIVVTFKK